MKKKRRYSYFTDKVIAVTFLTGVLLFVAVFLICTKYEQSDGNRMIEETLDFMKMQCLRYDNLVATDQAEDQIQLLDKTKELGRCLEEGTASDEDFLKNYAENQRISGIILLDQDGNASEAIFLDETTYEDWDSILHEKNILNVMQYPQKSYISRIQEENGTIYDYAAIAQSSGQGLVFCYTRRMTNEADEMSIGLDNLLSGYRLEMDGRILITDGSLILSTNEEELQEQDVSAYPLIADHKGEISSDKTKMLKQDGTTYLARYSKFRNYYLYVFFPAKEVFQQRSVFIAYVLILYILLLLVIAVIRQREMQNSNQLKMKFLRQMSHDIRTPINGIRGMIQIGNSFPNDMEKQKECRDKIWEASGFLIDLVNDVLDMGKLESGEIKLEEKPFHLQELLQNQLEIMDGHARDRKVTLQLGEMKVEDWNLIGSPVHIRRVLTNIITNAIRYNRENGTVTISCRELKEKPESDTALYEFVCADTGIGMSPEFQKHMFKQFTQENITDELSHHGTGLGLTIVENLVKAMNGRIRCESERDKGTVFYITIPFVIDRNIILHEVPVEPAVIESESEPEMQLEGISILLVEDNELNMEIAGFLLEEEGAVVQKAWNGQEAVQIFQNSNPGDFQIILMDIMMPVMDGETAVRMIRALDRTDAKTIPIIAMTANTFEDDITSALQAGMNAHLAKPINAEQLKKVIKDHLI